MFEKIFAADSVIIYVLVMIFKIVPREAFWVHQHAEPNVNYGYQYERLLSLIRKSDVGFGCRICIPILKGLHV